MSNYKIILGSKSPRRKSLLQSMGFSFSVRTQNADENFPAGMPPSKVAEFLACQKAEAFTNLLPQELLITADTTVVSGDQVMNKPQNKDEAVNMLKTLSGSDHYVYSGVCIKTIEKTLSFTGKTTVSFYPLSNAEIDEYIEKCKPFDKAGSYGIQELIGHRGVKEIHGSYNNVVGLPTSQLYQTLKDHFDFQPQLP